MTDIVASTDAASEESPAKRHKITERKSLRDVRADEFVSKIEYFRGPEVIIHVGTRDYKLPKLLVTHYSAFFDKAFNDNFKEGEEQEVRLDLGTSDASELAIQWMYNGKIVLPEEAMTNSGSITRLVDFPRLADGVDLLDPFTVVIESVRLLLSSSRQELQPAHIRQAVSLPAGHALRNLFAEAYIGPYMTHLWSGEKTPFKFGKELGDIEEFAPDMFKALDAIMRNKQSEYIANYSSYGSTVYSVVDLMTKQKIRLC